MSSHGRSEARLALLGELARDAVKSPSALELEQGLARLRAEHQLHRARPRGARRVALLAAAALACVALGVLLVPRVVRPPSGPAPVVVSSVVGGKILEGGYLSEVGGKGVRLDFSEGSQFVLAPGTRGRLRSVSADGAHLVLDHGTASFRITKNPDRRWSVEAGPFVVSVRGTDFTVVWDAPREELVVRLRQGRVAVAGPVVGEELVLRPGQSLRVNLGRRESVISEGGEQEPEVGAASPPAVPPAASAAPLASPGGVPPAVSAQAVASPGAGGPRRWREALAKGQWDLILADAEREGVEASLKSLSSEDLFALADAARYGRRPELARAALLAQRERFPSSARALDAAFLLGRVEELRPGGKSRALEWYDDYLARAPSGTYAAEALGRKLILVKETQGPAEARQVAEEYLARFPSGSYAAAARKLERSP